MYINKAIIYGNITKDPETKALPSGMKVCNFSVATNRVWKDKNGAKQESVDYHNVVIFGRSAEVASQYLKKGSGVYIEGRMQTRSWDSADGQKKYRTEIIADRFQFGPKSGGSSSVNNSSNSTNADEFGLDDKSSKTAKKVEKSGSNQDDAIDYPTEEINAEDIPF